MIGTSALAVLMVLAFSATAIAAVPRRIPVVAEIITVKGDEQVQFIDDPRWRIAELRQDLAGGDALQTGAYGGLAILFRDETQIRIHRNSSLIVKDVRSRAGQGETLLRLEKGAAWSRAKAIPPNLKMETPSATAAIRGTDWHLKVEDDGRSTLTVLAGEVSLSNEFGSVTVTRGEVGIAEVGAPPTKTFLLTPKDRPQWELVVTPDWVRIIPVTGLTTGELKAARRRLTEAARTQRGAAVLLDLAEVAYELGEVAETRRALDDARAMIGAQPGELLGRVRLVEGLLLAYDHRFDEADRVFEEAAQHLSGRRLVIARLGRYLMLVVERRYREAETALVSLLAMYDTYPEVHLAEIQLTSFRSDQEKAIELARRAQTRFPRDSRFPTWLAHLNLLVDEPDRMREAVDAALALDDEQYLAWHLRGTYYQFVRPDVAAARRAYQRTIEINPNYPPPWNNLGLLHIDVGDYEAARAAIVTAMRLAPLDALYRVTLGSLLIIVLDRLEQGEEVARDALAADPMQSGGMLLMGSLALKRGQTPEAIDWMLRATVANPGLAGANTSLAIGYYQSEQFELADRTIENAPGA